MTEISRLASLLQNNLGMEGECGRRRTCVKDEYGRRRRVVYV